MWDKYILELKDVLPVGLCQYMIDKFEGDDNKEDGVLPYCIDGKIINKPKYNVELDISAFPDEWVKVTDELNRYIGIVFKKYIEHLHKEFDISDREHIYLREITDIYENRLDIRQSGYCIHKIKKGDKYSWHHDGEFNYPCFVQMIIYLNTLEDDEGGCTEFINKRKVKPETGKILVYPQSWLFPHCGNEVKNEAKYICTTGIFLYQDRDECRTDFKK